MAGRKHVAITERQFGVLRALWKHGPLTVRQLLERMPGSAGQPYTTVLGLLQNMEKAGLVTHEEEGAAYRYLPAVNRRDATGELLRDFLARFFRGSAEELVVGLVDSQALTPEDLLALEAKLQKSSPHGAKSTERARPTRNRRRSAS